MIKPASATLAGGRTTRPLAGVGLDLKSPGLGAMEAVGGAYGGARGGGGGGQFGDPRGPGGGAGRGRPFVSYDTGPVPMGRSGYAEAAAHVGRSVQDLDIGCGGERAGAVGERAGAALTWQSQSGCEAISGSACQQGMGRAQRMQKLETP
jgi:hypothetical protein